jgi:hypothetical protein
MLFDDRDLMPPKVRSGPSALVSARRGIEISSTACRRPMISNEFEDAR